MKKCAQVRAQPKASPFAGGKHQDPLFTSAIWVRRNGVVCVRKCERNGGWEREYELGGARNVTGTTRNNQCAGAMMESQPEDELEMASQDGKNIKAGRPPHGRRLGLAGNLPLTPAQAHAARPSSSKLSPKEGEKTPANEAVKKPSRLESFRPRVEPAIAQPKFGLPVCELYEALSRLFLRTLSPNRQVWLELEPHLQPPAACFRWNTTVADSVTAYSPAPPADTIPQEKDNGSPLVPCAANFAGPVTPHSYAWPICTLYITVLIRRPAPKASLA